MVNGKMNNTTTLINETINNTLPLVPTIDPNWFYSAIAQSSAAIVGIMGAFLISKIIHKKQIQNNLYFKIADLEKEIKSIEDQDEEERRKDNQELIKNPGSMYASHFSYSGGGSHNRTISLKSRIREYEIQIKALNKNKVLFGTIIFMTSFALLGVFLPLGMLLTNHQYMIDHRFVVFWVILFSFILMMVTFLLEIFEFRWINKIKLKFVKKKNDKSRN